MNPLLDSPMSLSKDLGDIFLRLAQTSCVGDALSQGVRLACRAGDCPGGAIVVDRESGRSPSYWFRHDPRGLLEQPAFHQAVLDSGSAPATDAACTNGGDSEETRFLAVPLCCGGREAGRLVLLASPDVDEAEVRDRLAAITAALGVLLLALESNVVGSQASILGRDAFRANLSAQIARSDRQGEVFSVLHVRAAGLDRCVPDNDRNPWSGVAWLGEVLLARLRRTDLIGLMAPDQLAVLLAGTGRLGARIAARRIELLLSAPEIRALYRSDQGSPELSWCVRTFPENAESPSDLCDVDWRSRQAAPTTSTARVT